LLYRPVTSATNGAIAGTAITTVEAISIRIIGAAMAAGIVPGAMAAATAGTGTGVVAGVAATAGITGTSGNH
jgi:hypothetical protein